MRIVLFLNNILMSFLSCIAWVTGIVITLGLLANVAFANVPANCARYQRDIMRAAHAELGLNAPIAVFAAQIHQESSCNPQAISSVGAEGMAQFMPATAKWWCGLNGLSAAECQPDNPVWAIQALIGYDHWLYDRVKGKSEFERWWAALRAYNGGLGNWQKEAAMVLPATDKKAIDSACGKARRSIRFCPENLGYPNRILLVLQARYLSWGRGVFA
jgi:hypothetical protein